MLADVCDAAVSWIWPHNGPNPSNQAQKTLKKATSYGLRTLGGVSLTRGGQPMAGSATQRRRLALLALIAASGDRGVSRDRLIGILWPDSEPARGRQVLAQWLHLIRRDLGDEDIVFGTADLRLNPACMTCDVSDLRLALERNDLETAAALYAGPFLDGFYLNGAPEFERWVEEERVRLASRIRGVYETLARTATEAGDLQGAVRWAERLSSHDPLSASAALHYMEALANAGDRAGAIRHARVYTSLSRTQLDVDPDPAIAAFARQLRATPVASAPATAHSVGTLPVPEPPSAASATTPMSWVMMIIAISCSVRRRSSRSRICAWMVTSSAVVGSSAIRSFGLHESAIAIITRWRMPPEN
mgnify:CR=1 FL=1